MHRDKKATHFVKNCWNPIQCKTNYCLRTYEYFPNFMDSTTLSPKTYQKTWFWNTLLLHIFSIFFQKIMDHKTTSSPTSPLTLHLVNTLIMYNNMLILSFISSRKWQQKETYPKQPSPENPSWIFYGNIYCKILNIKTWPNTLDDAIGSMAEFNYDGISFYHHLVWHSCW